jgi:hypothetical protein
MEIIRGKNTSVTDASAIAERLYGYDIIQIDIGTGDGRYVQHVTQTCPSRFVIGIDACRENLHEVSRRAPTNAMFVITNALMLPAELCGLAAHVTINFPWGSLLEGLITDEPSLLDGLVMIARPNAGIEVRLNGGALAEIGWSLEAGAERVRAVLAANGFKMQPLRSLSAVELRSCPTTWAKRLAFGRDPRAIHLSGSRKGNKAVSTEFAMDVANLA